MHKHYNGLKTALLLGGMVGLLMLIGGGLSTYFRSSIFIWGFALVSLGTVAYSYWNSDKLALRSMNAYAVTREDSKRLRDRAQPAQCRRLLHRRHFAAP